MAGRLKASTRSISSIRAAAITCALRVSYPNAADHAQAARRGVSAGSDIMIHGLPNGLGWLGGWHLYA